VFRDLPAFGTFRAAAAFRRDSWKLGESSASIAEELHLARIAPML